MLEAALSAFENLFGCPCTMDAFEALAIMIGLLAVTTTSDTIPSVLFAVPGTTGSQATILRWTSHGAPR